MMHIVDFIKAILLLLAIPIKGMFWLIAGFFKFLGSFLSGVSEQAREFKKLSMEKSEREMLLADQNRLKDELEIQKQENLIRETFEAHQLIRTQNPEGMIRIEALKIKYGAQNVNDALKKVHALTVKIQ
jgi:hypothetical protein